MPNPTINNLQYRLDNNDNISDESIVLLAKDETFLNGICRAGEMVREWKAQDAAESETMDEAA